MRLKLPIDGRKQNTNAACTRPRTCVTPLVWGGGGGGGGGNKKKKKKTKQHPPPPPPRNHNPGEPTHQLLGSPYINFIACKQRGWMQKNTSFHRCMRLLHILSVTATLGPFFFTIPPNHHHCCLGVWLFDESASPLPLSVCVPLLPGHRGPGNDIAFCFVC
jgi:hypothetical protein